MAVKLWLIIGTYNQSQYFSVILIDFTAAVFHPQLELHISAKHFLPYKHHQT